MNPVTVANIMLHYIIPIALGLYLFFKIGMPILRGIGLFIGLIVKILNMLMVIILGLLEKLARLVHKKKETVENEERLDNFTIID